MFKKPVSYGSIETGSKGVMKGWTLLDKNHPFSDNFNPDIGDTPKEIVTYLLALQCKYQIGLVLSDTITTKVLQRQVKLLFRTYLPIEIKRGIALAVLYANHPFTFKFVEEILVQWRNGTIG